MIFRIIFGFSGAGKGWAETHAMLSSLNNPKDLMPTLSDIASKRVQMLGREYSIVGIRASRYATDAGVRTRGAFLQKQKFSNSVTTISAAAEPAEVALLVRGSAKPAPGNPEFDANVNQTFLGAPLDDCVDNAGVVNTGKGGLLAAFGSWRNAVLAANLGWLANRTVLNTGLAAIAQNADGTVTLTTVDNSVPPLVQGHKYKARVRDVNAGVSPLNGELVVIAGANKTLVTREVIGLALVQAGGFIRVYQEIQPFVAYGDLTLNLLVGNHKKGRPFGSTPGRARRRVRG